MADATCLVDECDRGAYCRGWCQRHYSRWQVHGDPTGGGPLRHKPATRFCSIEDCGKPVFSSGWCSNHRYRAYTYGDPLHVPWSSFKRPPEERFWVKVDRDGPVPPHRPELGPCWIWTAHRHPTGYGRFAPYHGDPGWLAHRYAWTLTNGTIPEGLDLDHLCRVKSCVRPSHLEPVTREENLRRARLISCGLPRVAWEQMMEWVADPRGAESLTIDVWGRSLTMMWGGRTT